MTQAETKARFIAEYYGSAAAYKQARKADKIAVTMAFSLFLDNLQRNGEITDKQYNNYVLR